MKHSIERINSKTPDYGQCILHSLDISSVCKEKQCEKQKYLCQQCQKSNKNHKDTHQSIPANKYLSNIVQNIIKTFPAKQQTKKIIVQQMKNAIQKFKDIQTKISNAIKKLQQISDNQWLLFCSILQINEINQNSLTSYLCSNDLFDNSQHVQNITTYIQKIDFKKFTEKLPDYVKNLTRKIDTLSVQIQGVLLKSTQITSSFLLKNISNLGTQQKITTPIVSIAEKDYFAVQVCKQLRKYNTQVIQQLNLQKNSINSAGLKTILDNDQFKFTNLKRLNLTNNMIDQQCLKVFLQLPKDRLPNLKQLILVQNLVIFNQQLQEDFKNKWGKDLQLDFEKI